MSRPDAVNVAALVERTRVEGPGLRFAIWVQGCVRRCSGCCNPELHEFVDADWLNAEDLAKRAIATNGIEGITLLGGEPFAQANAVATVAEHVQSAGLSVVAFTGFELEELEAGDAPWASRRLLESCDLLIDGPFQQKQQSRRRRYIGSDNQRIHFLSPRYRHLQGHWPPGDAGAEIRLRRGDLSYNGHPREDLRAWVERLGISELALASRGSKDGLAK